MAHSILQDRRVGALIVLLLAALGLAIALAFFGVGAELSKERTVVLSVRVVDLQHEVSDQLRVGDTVFADAGGMSIGKITDVRVGPVTRAVADSQGGLQASADPTLDEAIVVIEAVGRQGDGIVALHNQVIQSGQSFDVVTKSLFMRGTVLSVEVR